MANAATQAKQRYNAGHYTQVKVSVDPEVASAFKSACAAAGASMAGKLTQFMADYSSTAINHNPPPDYATRRKRRAVVRSLLQQLALIKDAEERYRDNIPDNLQSSVVYDSAEQVVSMLEEVIDLLGSVY